MSNAYLNAQVRDSVVCAFRRSKMIEPKRRFTVTVELHQVGDPTVQRPYFSVTAEERNLRRHADNQIEACGCMHEEVLKHWPDLQSLVDMHLSDDNGKPMHAAANMAYWLGFGQHAVDLKLAASHWRVSETEAEEIRQNVEMTLANDGGEGKRYDRAQAILQKLIEAKYRVQWVMDASQAKAFIIAEHAARTAL